MKVMKASEQIRDAGNYKWIVVDGDRVISSHQSRESARDAVRMYRVQRENPTVREASRVGGPFSA